MNKIQLIGRVGGVNEYTSQDGSKFVKLSLATNEYYTQDGERKEATEWHSLIVNGRLVDVIRRYVGKGKQIYVEGKMRYRKYTGRDNIERTVAEVYVNGLELLGGGDISSTNNDDS
jgi:single-strand DNA-binding protein